MCLWLLGKAVKGAGWLLVFAVVIAAWPLTLITAAGYVLAWRRGWPGAWLCRTAAWSLALPAAWLAAAAIDSHDLRASALAPVRAWEHGWPYPATWLAAAREFALFVPATVPAGLALAAGLWAWRNYAITTGLGGITASAPITFDARQWKHQVRTAKGLTEAPGAVPLLARGGKDPGRRHHPYHRPPLAPGVHPSRGGMCPAHGDRGGDRQREPHACPCTPKMSVQVTGMPSLASTPCTWSLSEVRALTSWCR